ncbi:MAG: hypothetical protein Q9221_001657 [Calogaya cf. arnoldii]
MPQLCDVTVHVTDVDGNNLEEWGVQSLRGNKVSAYIRSTTDMPFRITVQPKMPYFDDDLASADTQGRAGSDDVSIKMEESSDDLVGQPSSSQRPSGASNNTWPPFTFLATLYLDGRRKPERRIVVYLDPNDEDFNPPNGLVKFKSRTVQGLDGVIEEHAWVFRDIGIETLFDKIALRENAGDAMEPEDTLVDAMKTSKLADGHDGTCEANQKIGQIVVELERVNLGRKLRNQNYFARHMEGDRDDVDMGGVGSDMVHTTGFEHIKSLEQRSIRCVEYEPYVREQLQKFNFPGYPQGTRQKSPRERQQLNTTLANFTPLSISQLKNKTPDFSAPEELSFETRVKEGSHEPTKVAKPEYEFNDYRDPLREISGKPGEVPGKNGKRDISTRSTLDPNSRSSKVVAVKEKPRLPSDGSKFASGPKKPSSSSLSSGSLSISPPSSPAGSPTQPPPANSPTAGSYYANSDGQSPIHRGSDFDVSKTLSSASLVLSKAQTCSADDTLRPKSFIPHRDIFRGEARSSSDDADADDEKDGNDQSEQGSWESADDDDDDDEAKIIDDWDKENKPSSADNNINDDAARLHEELNKVTLGSKRQRGEGMEQELEDGEIIEKDDSAIDMDSGDKKKKTSPTRLSDPEQVAEREKEQQAKRPKLLEWFKTEGGESTQRDPNEKPVMMTMTMDDAAKESV